MKLRELTGQPKLLDEGAMKAYSFLFLTLVGASCTMAAPLAVGELKCGNDRGP